MTYNLSNKTILITGANSGIGKAASIQLAGMGAYVVMMCRNRERGEQALQDVRSASNNRNAELILVDMVSQESVRNYGTARKSSLLSKERKLL
jgi:retinol dehydrogenase-13